jgi:hypothetical protein
MSDATTASPPEGKRRLTKIVVLTLLGAGGAFVAWDFFKPESEPAEESMQREGYLTKADCERNYTPAECQPGETTRPGGLGMMPIFWGPLYRAGGSSFFGQRAEGAPRVDKGAVTEARQVPPGSVSQRGGFGRSGTATGSGS